MKVGDLVKYKCTFSRYSGQVGVIVEVVEDFVLVEWPDTDDESGVWYPHWHLWSV